MTLAALIFFVAIGAARAQDKQGKVHFSREVLPILSNTCFSCHGPDATSRKASLRLDLKEDALRSKDPIIVPGKSGDSELIRRISSKDPREVMPPTKALHKLTPAQVQTLTRWVDEGAAWGLHWAYEKPVRPALPVVKNKAWIRNPVDSFVLARLEREGLAPSAEASREILLRRLTLDLTGLPPTPAELDAFTADNSPDAYEKVVDRLLASPRFGERMAWDWLDAARYADSNGYQGDQDRSMWPWRDWVVEAFNANMPYDRFTVLQLAGDLLPKAGRDEILPTAFNRNHMINGEGGRIPEENRIEYLFDQTETLATVWLGLTLTCARCHDHRFDPLTRKDYYQMLAFFNRTPVNGGGGSGRTAPVLDFSTPEQTKKRAELEGAFNALAKTISVTEARLREAGMVKKDGKVVTKLPEVIESSLRKGPNDRATQNYDELSKFYKESEPAYVKRLGELLKLRKAREQFATSLPQVMVMADTQPRDTFILTRGTYNKLETKVGPGVPASLPPLPKDAPANRLGLARWLVGPDNPLTARVTVNRYWQMIFGTGLVKTTEDFGLQGQEPSHPELLDWLATEFQNPTRIKAQGWDVKNFLRLIVTSATYRQSSKVTPALAERDPDNRLLARASRYRLPSWMIRDQALAASGLLVDKLGGPSVKPYQPPGIWEEATFGNKKYEQDHGPNLYRRSLYVFWRRIVGPTMFFDSAARQTCSVNVTRTNTPLHALTTLNDITYVEAARALGQRVLENPKLTPRERIDAAFRLVLGRRPSSREAGILGEGLTVFRTKYATDKGAAEKLLKVGESPRNGSLDVVEHAAYTSMCLLLLNLDEALTRQ